jgi:hypothetical protein
MAERSMPTAAQRAILLELRRPKAYISWTGMLVRAGRAVALPSGRKTVTSSEREALEKQGWIKKTPVRSAASLTVWTITEHGGMVVDG